MATVLNIDHPSWPVVLDFMKSDIAFRKSDRNAPTEENLSSDEQPSDSSNATRKNVLTEVNFDRIKSITVIRVTDVAKIGTKPLTEPYRAIVIWQNKARRVYDFLSFEEFKLDIKKMLVGELEFYSIIMSLIAVIVAIALQIIKRFYRSYLSRKNMETQTEN